jgi:aminoglycoside phosphotransferase (APT) family kinase protein
VVQRVRTAGGTAIVKRFLGDAAGFPREVAALRVLPPSAPVPRLLEVRESPPAVVMSDLGSGPSVATRLLGSSPEAATDALTSWASAIARLHDVSAGLGDAFRAALSSQPLSSQPLSSQPLSSQPLSYVADDVVETVRSLSAYAAELGVPVPSAAAWEHLRQLGDRLESGPAVLSPGDTCPDNNVDTPGGLMLLDFEAAQWRHPAWDVAYLVVPWPTCWCSWRLPAEVAEQAIGRYQQASERPWARSAGFRADVEAAVTVWAFTTTALFLAKALGDDPPPADPAKLMPPRRAVILDRLARVSSEGPLSSFATSFRSALVERWGEVALRYAPAFAARPR